MASMAFLAAFDTQGDTNLGDVSPVDVPENGFADSLALEVFPPKKMFESPTASSLDVSRDVKALARRIKDLESRQQCVEERFVQDRIAAPEGGPTPSQWSQMQGEMERVRRLFEFVESVLPREPAEAMRFFNRSRSGSDSKKEAAKEDLGAAAAAGRPLGFEVELERYKAHVEKEVRRSQAAMHQEVSNCMLAIKGLQRDVDITRGALLAERPRLLRDAEASKRVQLPAAAAEGTGGTRIEEGEMPPGQLVSRQHVQGEVSNLRDEVKTWLDQLSETVRSSLQHKMDKHALVGGDQSMVARRALQGRAQQRQSSPPLLEAGGASFDASTLSGKNWRPSSSPGIKQLRAPGAAACGPGSKSLPKFPDAVGARPFSGPEGKALRSR